VIRQRVRLRGFGLTELLLRAIVSLLAAALVFYGVIVVLAAFKLDPRTLNDVSGYDTVLRSLSAITPGSISGRDRIVVAAAGLACLLVFGPRAWRALPRPYLARTTLDVVADDAHGQTEVAPRALERIAEGAAGTCPEVRHVAARYAVGAMQVRVELGAAEHLLATLTAVQRRVRDALRAHGLPDGTLVDVTFGGVGT
jgi:hypothetical protein